MPGRGSYRQWAPGCLVTQETCVVYHLLHDPRPPRLSASPQPSLTVGLNMWAFQAPVNVPLCCYWVKAPMEL